MPSSRRNKATTPHPTLTSAMALPAGTAPTTTAIARGRTTTPRPAGARAGNFANVKALQFLSFPRTTDANQVLGTVKASGLVNYVNLICTIESAQPGFIAQNPEWAYTIGAQMFGTE